MSRGADEFTERYGGFRLGESEGDLLARMAAIDAIHTAMEAGTAVYADLEQLNVLRGDMEVDADLSAGFPTEPAPQKRNRTNPPVRYVYFLQKLDEPRLIKIGAADDLPRRLADHRRTIGFDFEARAMRWKNTFPDDDGKFENGGMLPPTEGWARVRGRAGTGWLAEQQIHALFDRERVDQRVKRVFGTRKELFKPSPRLLRFMSDQTVPISEVASAPVHELTCTSDGEWCSFSLPDYMDKYEVPFLVGYKASQGGGKIGHNPFPKDGPDWREWRRGWRIGAKLAPRHDGLAHGEAAN